MKEFLGYAKFTVRTFFFLSLAVVLLCIVEEPSEIELLIEQNLNKWGSNMKLIIFILFVSLSACANPFLKMKHEKTICKAHGGIKNYSTFYNVAECKSGIKLK